MATTICFDPCDRDERDRLLTDLAEHLDWMDETGAFTGEELHHLQARALRRHIARVLASLKQVDPEHTPA